MSDQKEITTIPYFAHEGEMNRLERVNRRQFVLILILILALVGTNLAWTIYENQFEDVVTETKQVDVEAEGGGNAIGFIGDENEVNYGESESN